MTTNTVPAILDAILDPLNSITKQVEAALALARRNKLPGSFIDTITNSVAFLDDAHDSLLEIATALDPNLAKDQP